MKKTIFVTGAASGIGRATARLFGERGWFVGCYDVDVTGARAVAEALGTNACHGRIDVTSEESWDLALKDFESQTASRMDVLFNCAGILRMGKFEEVSPAECRKQLDVNVMGVILGIQICLPALERSRGTIINMSSASAVYGQPGLAVYSATKFAVRALTEALDIELRARGIRVCDIMPGYVDTPMVSSQENRSRTLEKQGAKLKAEEIAEIAWKALQGTQLHYIPQLDVNALEKLGGLSQDLGRFIMHRVAK